MKPILATERTKLNRSLYAACAMIALVSSLARAQQAQSQPAPVPSPGSPIPLPAPAPPTTGQLTAAGQRTFPAQYFTRFKPVTAWDMLIQVPGFTIRGADNERGLGQASENVLIDGRRIANKSGGAIQQLRTTDASVVDKIELVDAAQLGIAGLSGVVANLVMKRGVRGHGQFSWNPDVRAHFTDPNLLRGNVSWTDRVGAAEYTLGVDNNRGSSSGFGGRDSVVLNPEGTLDETRVTDVKSHFDQPFFKVATKLDLPGSSIANLSVRYGPYWYNQVNREDRDSTFGDDSRRTVTSSQRGYTLDFNGDYEFQLGPGKMKFIGLRHFEHEPFHVTQRSSFVTDRPDEGVKLFRDTGLVEFIVRAEYGWKSGSSDWQLTAERTVNTLDQKGYLSILNAQGQFEPVDFPGGTGNVAEHRYEATATFGRSLSPRLDLQIVAGAEVSKLERVDRPEVRPRNFFRPKGSVSLAWRPGEGWDASFKASRKVGQISFYDYLAQVDLDKDRENAGNSNLVPPQSWQIEAEVGRDLGKWGKVRAKTYYNIIHDIVDIIPIGTNAEAVGNLPRATEKGVELSGTLQLDPIGWKGAKLDLQSEFQTSSVKDPLTGEKRQISGNTLRRIGVGLRHDIPGSQIAWGANVNSWRPAPYVYLTEVQESYEGPAWSSLFVEHKNVMGLNVRASVGNLLNARHKLDRTVYGGFRDFSPVLFRQRQNLLIGPVFSLTVKGKF